MVFQPLFLSANASTGIAISIPVAPSALGVIVSYLTDAARAPSSFGDQLYAWQTTSNTVPWNKGYAGAAAVPSDASSGSVYLGFPYEQLGYIIGYAVATSPRAVCATVYIPQGATGDPARWAYGNVSCSMIYATSSLVQVNYAVLADYLPASNRNWVGIWQGTSVPYQGEPLGWSYVPADAQVGSVIVQGLGLTINTSYAVGYFMADRATGRTALAAQATFTVGGS
jgi:hypothetical protein